MVKTQVQIPDHLHREAKRIARQYEMSFAEVVRRGLERLVPSYPPRGESAESARLPRLDLGLIADPFADPEWRSALHLGAETAAEPPAARPETARRKGSR
jgi:hypothetical protein